MRGMIAAPDSYAREFAAAVAALPGDRAWQQRREERFAAFSAAGFPGPKVEEWKYTNIGKLARTEFALADAASVEAGDLADYVIPDARLLVFVNGHFAPQLSHPGALHGELAVGNLADALAAGDARVQAAFPELDPERSLSALNGALTAGGAFIHVPDGAALDDTVQALFVSVGTGTPAIASPRNLVLLGDRARLSLVETHVALGEGEVLTNLVNRFVVGKDAELMQDRLQFGKPGHTLLGKSEWTVGDRSKVDQSLAQIGGGLVRNETQAVLDGSEVAFTLNGVFMGAQQEHLDNTILIEHAKPNSMSDQFYKGIMDGRAKGVFAGKIKVHKPAQKTNAYQSNNNLLLSDEAEVDTKPELEIYADDVKCSHGATVGELDERELFYLRSRGVDEPTARTVMTYAFAGEVLERFHLDAAREQARRELLARLPGGEALKGMT